MFNLETAIATWRQLFAHRKGVLKEDLDELERHLRDHVIDAVKRGIPEEAAFCQAVDAIGGYDEAEKEYQKVYWGKLLRRRKLGNDIAMRFSMFKNYVKTALRSLTRKKGFSFINIAGLTIGLACCLLIFQYVAFETSYDRFHENEQNLYRVILGSETRDGLSTYTPQAMGPAFQEAIPEVERFTRLFPISLVVSNPSHPERVFEDAALFADPSFLEMFTFPLVSGSAETALEPGTALLSESAARRYFGDENPIGEVLSLSPETFRVVGVFRDVAVNSHLQFDLLLPMADRLSLSVYRNEDWGGWARGSFITFLQLHPGADVASVEQRMTEVNDMHRGERLREFGVTQTLYAQPLRDVYLNPDVLTGAPGALRQGGSYRAVYFFTIIGLVTLLIALVNYVNLATARSLDRAREVGMRKAIGARRGQLIGQFMAESALTIGAAALLAVVLATVLMPVVNNLADTHLMWALWLNPGFWMAFVATLAVATLLAGLYPAFVLSAFQPVSVLKGRVISAGGQLWLRRGLVVFQFAAAVVLIGGTAVVYNQLSYMRNMDLGLDLEQVLTVRGPRVMPPGTGAVAGRAAFVEEIRRLSAVRDMATSHALPGQGFNTDGTFWLTETGESSAIRGMQTWIDTSFVSLYGLELIAGRFEEFSGSAATPTPVLINETSARAFGFAAPEEAIGQGVVGIGDASIVGVLRDFHWTSAHEAHPNILLYRTAAGQHVSIRVARTDLPGTIAAIERIYTEMFPGNVFEYGFADQGFEQQYREDRRFATLFSLFAALAIGIACLGLFGLATFTAQQRTKEIGVRKVMGASVGSLAALLSRDFLKLVGLAVVIGLPVVYLLMSRWLEGFAYHIELGAGVFVLVALVTLAIAFLTVAYQSVRAAMADPVRSLRTE